MPSVADALRQFAPPYFAATKNFLFHHGTLIRVYKAKLADEPRAAGLHSQIDTAVRNQKLVAEVTYQSLGSLGSQPLSD